MESLLHTFGIEWKMLIAQLVNFGILFFVLTKLVYKPLLKNLAEKEKSAKESEEKTSSIENLLKETEEKQKQVIAEARLHGEKIIKDAESNAQLLKNTIVEDAKKEASKIIEIGEKNIKEDQERFRKEFKSEALNLIAEALEKTVGKHMNEASKNSIKEESLKEILKAKELVS